MQRTKLRFNGHPPLGVNATMLSRAARRTAIGYLRFNGHPPLGVNATHFYFAGRLYPKSIAFQWAPTLGGECYLAEELRRAIEAPCVFQWAPTLGGECY